MVQGVPEVTDNAAPELMSGDVRDYLLAHPDFLNDNGDILAELIPPEQRRGDSVQDFNRHMLMKLQEHVASLKDEHDGLLELLQQQLQRQNQVNAAMLSMMDCDSFDMLIHYVTHEMALLLGQEKISLFLEAGDDFPHGAYGGAEVVADGFVYQWLGQRDILLEDCHKAAPEIFAARASKIRSQAFVRLNITENMPPAMLALGHGDPMYYATGLATEQVECLGAILERCIRKWLRQTP